MKRKEFSEALQNVAKSFAQEVGATIVEKMPAPEKKEAPQKQEVKVDVAQKAADYFSAVYYAKRENNTEVMKSFAEKYLEGKSMSTLVGEDGGYLVPEDVSGYIRELANDYGIARRVFTQYPMTSMKEIMPSLVTGAAAYWVDEASNGTPSSAKLANPELSAKQLIGLTVASNVSLKASKANLGAFISKQLAIAIAQKEDDAALNGDGSGPAITGVFVDTNITEVAMAAADVTFSGITPEKLHEVVMSINSALRIGAKWIVSSTVLLALMNLKDTDGRYLYQGLQNEVNKTLLGFPVEESSVAPSTEGADKPVLVFGNFEVAGVLGEYQTQTLDVSSEATITIPGDSPVTINLFQSNQSATRLIEMVDYVTVLPKALVRLMTGSGVSA